VLESVSFMTSLSRWANCMQLFLPTPMLVMKGIQSFLWPLTYMRVNSSLVTNYSGQELLEVRQLLIYNKLFYTLKDDISDIPALQKHRFPLFIDDAEPAVHLAVRMQAPNLVSQKQLRLPRMHRSYISHK